MKKILLLLLTICTTAIVTAQNNGDYRSAASGTWSAAGTWEKFDGTNWNAATTAPALADGAINVMSGHTVTMDATMSIDSVFVQAGGTLGINSGITITVPVNPVSTGAAGIKNAGTVNVSGKVLNQGVVNLGSGGVYNWNNGSEYEHAQNAGSVPTSTWNTGSTCTITGTAGNAPSNSKQNYHNFTWNCAGQTANVNLGWHGNTISGTLKCSATGSVRLQLSNNLAGGSTGSQLPNLNMPINITAGAIEVTGGTMAVQGSSSTNGAANYTLNVLGNFTITGGSFSASAGTSSYITIINIGGDFSTTSTVTPSYVKGSTYSADLSGYPPRVTKTVFNKMGTQTFTNAAAANMTSGSIFEVATGATLDLNTSIISNGTSRLICNYNSGLIMSGADGLNTNITSGTHTYAFDPQVSYTFNGTGAQITGSKFTDALGPAPSCQNFTINNSGASGSDTLRLSTPFLVYGALTLTDGIILPTTTNALTLENTATIVGGSAGSNVAKRLTFNTNTTNPLFLPLGKSGIYRPITIIPATADATTWEAEFFEAGNANTTNLTAPVISVPADEYWNINRTAGTANAILRADLQRATPGVAATDKVGIVHYSAGNWQWEGGTALSPGNASSGTVETAVTTSFSPFAIGGLDPTTLPIRLVNFTVSYNGSTAQLQWSTTNEIDVQKFEIQKSKDGVNFQTIGNVTALNRVQLNNYQFDDASILEGKVYYKIKTIDLNGTFTFSKIISINTKQNKNIQVYPNPASNVITVAIPKSAVATTIQLYSATGKLIQSTKLPANTIITSMYIGNITPGNYYLQTDGLNKQSISFIKQ